MISCKEREASLMDGHSVCPDDDDNNNQSAVTTSSANADHEEEEEEEEGFSGIRADVAWKFLLAGGIAGAGEPQVYEGM
jgi:hypothetical protein